MDQYIIEAKQIIEENIYCTIATASSDSKPWISPVFYAFDEGYNFYWVSDKNALHSKNINQNPHGAIVIFNSQAPEGEGDGVYIEAKLVEITEEKDILHAIKLRNNRVTQEEFKVKSLHEVIGEGVWRVYKAIPLKIYKLTDGEYINGQYVDKRVEVKLND